MLTFAKSSFRTPERESGCCRLPQEGLLYSVGTVRNFVRAGNALEKLGCGAGFSYRL